MYNVIYDHLLHAGVHQNFIKYKKQLGLIESIVFWHNDGFALLSGIIGYKTNKYSNLLYLWLYVLFYSVSINYFYQKYITGIIYTQYIFQLFIENIGILQPILECIFFCRLLITEYQI